MASERTCNNCRYWRPPYVGVLAHLSDTPGAPTGQQTRWLGHCAVPEAGMTVVHGLTAETFGCNKFAVRGG